MADLRMCLSCEATIPDGTQICPVCGKAVDPFGEAKGCPIAAMIGVPFGIALLIWILGMLGGHG